MENLEVREGESTRSNTIPDLKQDASGLSRRLCSVGVMRKTAMVENIFLMSLDTKRCPFRNH